MKEYTVRVHGMRCRSCGAVVRRELTALPGVASVDPDPENDEVVVRGESGVVERARRAIAEIGYGVGSATAESADDEAGVEREEASR
jgi:copper chaperone CopZ